MEEFDFFYAVTVLVPGVLAGLLFWLYKSKKIGVRNQKRFMLAWNMLFTLFLLSGVFFIGESYFRFFVDTTDSFGLSKISQRWMKNHYHYNNFSARDNLDYQLDIAPGKRRVTIIGDSFAAGHGIKNVEHRFANILREKFPELEVHVMAINGVNSLTELDILRKLAQDQYQFDIILLSYCLNDIDYLVPEAQDIYDRIYNFNNALGYLGNQSYFLNTLKFRWFALHDPDFLNYSDFVLAAYEEDSWTTHKKSLHEIRKFSEENGRVFAVVTFPFLQESRADYLFLGVHQKLEAYWRSENVLHLDLLKTYAPFKGSVLTVNKYDAHPNEFASKLAARKIGDFLKTN